MVDLCFGLLGLWLGCLVGAVHVLCGLDVV